MSIFKQDFLFNLQIIIFFYEETKQNRDTKQREKVRQNFMGKLGRRHLRYIKKVPKNIRHFNLN